MAFGLIMEFEAKLGLRVKMAPFAREDMATFVEDGRMQSMQVGRYLGRNFAPVLEDEYDWYDKIRTDQVNVLWGIYVQEKGEWKLIGTSGIHGLATNTMFRRGTTGVMLFAPEYWGRGIASACHRARTWYAFWELGVSVLYSSAYTINQGSTKALEKVGYVRTGMNRNEGMHAGQFLHANHYELVNPADWAWSAWWQGVQPAQEWLDARQKTLEALWWAEANIRFP